MVALNKTDYTYDNPQTPLRYRRPRTPSLDGEQLGIVLGPTVLPKTTAGYFLHHTGVLIPLDQHVSSFYTDGSWAVNVPTPVVNPIYEASPVPFDLTFDITARIVLTISGFLLPEAVGTPTFQGQVDYWVNAGADYQAWQNWSAGSATFRKLRARTTQNTSLGVAALAVFNVRVDNAPTITDQSQPGTTVAVAAGGSTIPFNQAFHIAPNVNVQVVGSTALYAVAVATPTNFTVHVFNSSGTDVGGNITWTAAGE